MVNSTITTSVSGNKVTIYANISPLDGVSYWGIYVYAHTDHGQGSGGSDPYYTYFVERISGSGTGTYAFDRTYSPDMYAAELALQGLGSVDASLFEIVACQPPGGVGNKCQDATTVCYWNQVRCDYDCQVCSSGICQNGVCSTPTVCNQQDYTITQDKNSVIIGGNVTFNVKMSGYPGREWRLISKPIGQPEVVLGSGTLDSNSCGTVTVPFSAIGTYILVGRVCEVWQPGAGGSHCALYDTDTNNSVALSVIPQPPPGTQGCINCDLTKNICLMGNCIPKNYVLIGAAGIVALMLLK